MAEAISCFPSSRPLEDAPSLVDEPHCGCWRCNERGKGEEHMSKQGSKCCPRHQSPGGHSVSRGLARSSGAGARAADERDNHPPFDRDRPPIGSHSPAQTRLRLRLSRRSDNRSSRVALPRARNCALRLLTSYCSAGIPSRTCAQKSTGSRRNGDIPAPFGRFAVLGNHDWWRTLVHC